MREDRLRLWFGGCVQMQQSGNRHDVNPRAFATLARSEDEATGAMIAWVMRCWPGQAIHAAKVYPVDDEMVLAAAQEARRDDR